MKKKKLITIVQLCPQLNIGGVERGVVDIAIYLKKMGYHSIVISNGGRLVTQLEDKQIKHFNLPIHSKNPIQFIINLWRISHLLASLKPDLLLPYSRIPTWLVYCLRKRVAIPFIGHCLGIHHMGRLGIKKRYNSVLVKGDAIIANSYFTQNYFLNHYPCINQRITVVPCSVDRNFFSPEAVQPHAIQTLRNQWNIGSGKTVILLPARMTSLKGHMVFIAALGIIKQRQFNNFYGVMLGDTLVNRPYYERLLQLIAQFNLNDDIFFAGEVVDMPAAYAAADIIVSTSTQPEAFGRVIVEAQAMGKIVVATNHGGALETIEDKHNGFLVEVGNPQMLADQLIEIQGMTPMNKIKISDEAKKNAAQFCEEKICAQLLKFYHETIDQARHREEK